LQNDATDLGDGEKSIRRRGEAKAFLSYPCARVNVNARAQQSMGQAGMRADAAVPPDHDASANDRSRADAATRADFRVRLDDRQRTNFSGGIDDGALGDNRRRVDPRQSRLRGMKQCGNPRPALVRPIRDDRHRRRWHPGAHMRVHNDGTGRGCLQGGRIAVVVEKAYFVPPRRLQWRNAAKNQTEVRSNAECGRRDG
jgi:hypothetical protein